MRADELPGEGALVALDAEFVREAEEGASLITDSLMLISCLHSACLMIVLVLVVALLSYVNLLIIAETEETAGQVSLLLARVTALRSWGDESAFIDDYIECVSYPLSTCTTHCSRAQNA